MKMNWLGLKHSTPTAILGGNLIVAGLVLAVISGLLFVINLCFQDFNLKIDSEKWGNFGDFIGGTWGLLVTAGSALLIVETIKQQQTQIENQTTQINKQEENERIRAFEARLIILINAYQEKKRIELPDIKSSAQSLLDFINMKDNELSNNAKIKNAYYLTFGNALKGIPKSTERILAENRYQTSNPETSQILSQGIINENYGSTHQSHEDLLRIILAIYKMINAEPNLAFGERLKYGELIRVMLSEEELILIAAFSQTDSGIDFERTRNEPVDTNQRLITKYSIIRNLAVDVFGQGILQNLFAEIHFCWMENEPESRKLLKFS